jgi:endonuclease V-like protein UPF0215 family
LFIGRRITQPLANVIGFDDAPFPRNHRGDVSIVGAVFARTRLDGVIVDRVRRDGANSTERIARAVCGSRFAEHAQAVVLQGIALAGFNVVDLHGLHRALGLPVLVVARRRPDLAAIRRALSTRVPGGARKWALIERAGAMEPLEGVWVQRAGLDPARAGRFLREFTVHGALPEPIRVAHLIAGAIATGESRGGA